MRWPVQTLLEIADQALLGDINAFVHDQRFSIDDLSLEIEKGILRLPFGKEDRANVRARWHHMLFSKWRVPLFEHILEFRKVRSYAVEDKAGIGVYTFEAIQVTPGEDRLVIQACENLRIQIEADAVLVSVLATGRRLGERTVRMILGCEIS